MQSQRAIGQALSSPAHQATHAETLRHSWLMAGIVALMLVSGCAQIRPYVPPSEGHIGAPQAKPEPEAAIPPPARISSFVPPPKPAIKPQTYSVVVNEVPVKELLLALARDTRQNIDIHAGLTGLVSLNAIDETLPAILDRVAKQVNLRYRVEGNTIVVSSDTPYLKTYIVNYVNIQRTTTSTTGASGQISAAGTGSSGGGGGAGGNTSSTTVTTTSNSDFWKVLEQSVRSILNSSLQQSLSAAAKQNRLELIKQEQDIRAKQMEAASKAGAAASSLATSLSGLGGGQQQNSSLLPDDVIVNPVAGTITVNGTDKQHQLVQDYLTKVENGAQRQVLIEATIVEVQLSDAYQGGIDWSRLQTTGDIAGFTLSQSLTGGFSGATALAGAAAGNAITVGVANNTRLGNIAASIKLLQEFGDTRVLSSPKLMVLNNQTALLKAVDNLVYFDIQAQTSTSTTGPSLTTFTTTAKSVAVGVVMGVTPQINEDGRVLLTVRPTVSRQLTPVQDPNPSLCDNAIPKNCISNLVPQIQVREMESVLQVGTGQTIILGGLMQDNVVRNREQLPGADKLGAAGEAFRFRNERVTKSELVIFLRPTVIKNPSLESEELKFFQRFLPQPEQPPAAKAGAAQ
ncbi:MAG: secretin N-terminal domain-containing protein [Burkholderiales bacterium]|nr:secretin N-terminal domain-containing protein [Burkholderiales bacterium]